MTDTMTLTRDTSTTVVPEQPELDLPSTLSPPTLPPASRSSRAKGAPQGLPPLAFATMAAVVVALLWGAWVTKTLMMPPAAVPMASVRLDQLVGEYVQAQARIASPPEVVTQQTQAFMAALGNELKRRGQSGTTVLVGEAVLSQNVPDITPDVRKAVYARVPMPAIAAPPMAVPMPAPVMSGPGSVAPPGAPVGQ